ncbi:TraX family protein [Clostridium sp. MD294]|uniref:TraX family protein n=1 Tax=Clostridium sp. MD294 TaxID=97138 RepID=UPI0002CB5971|nr:TraX family protein [Clostridium sp. MD294]NDO47288.1 hypothetical protein [Clostridium sp. MD294]USF29643.1 hypothetical protein C820_001043 [Clostridium sp. MD294]
MNITIIKLVAAFTMLLDHIAEVFGMAGWWFFDGEMLRNIGRIAFPLFAFAVVNGWYHTKDKCKYFSKIALFAAISQIPYSLAFRTTNTIPLEAGEKLYYIGLSYKWYVLLFFVVIILLNYCFMKKNNIALEKYHIMLFLLLLFYSVEIKINGIWILYDELNVLNTFLCGLLILHHYEYIKKNSIDKKCVYSVINSMMFVLLCFYRADYGDYFAGIALVLLLYFTYHKKLMSSIVIIIWAFVLYAVVCANLKNALFAMLSIVFVLLYNERKLPRLKNFFYIWYPFHILLIGIVNIIIKIT